MMKIEPAAAFDAVVDSDTRVLLLGSLPGCVSLAERRYYAHPQNQFWRLMSPVAGINLWRLDYNARLAALRTTGIGLWDVIATAVRSGSLDQAIRAPQIRDLGALISTLPKLRALAFNGGTALRLGLKQLGGGVTLPVIALPSSSAALTVGIAAKQPEWDRLRAYLL